MKRIIAAMLAMGFVFAFAACNPGVSPENSGETGGIDQSELESGIVQVESGNSGETSETEQTELGNSEETNETNLSHVGQSIALWEGATHNSIF